MNLTYEISQTTNLDATVIKERILLMTKRRKYGVTIVTDNTVTFDSHYGGVIFKSEYSGRLDNGTFEIISRENENVLLFEYCSIPQSEYLFVFTVAGLGIVLSIMIQNYAPLISLGFLIILLYKYFNLKNIAKEILAEILNQ